MNWNNILAFVLFGLLQIGCAEPPPPGRYDGALVMANGTNSDPVYIFDILQGE